MKKCEKFLEILVEHDRINPQDIFPPPIESQFALDCLTEALLGPNYYIALPCSNDQGNAIILDDILKRYSKKYRKLIKKRQEELKHERKSKGT